MTLKSKPNHPNGSVQKSQDRKKHFKFGQMCRFCSQFSAIAMAGRIMNFCHKIVWSIWNTSLKLCADGYGVETKSQSSYWNGFSYDWGGKRKIETVAVGDTKKRVSEVFRGLEKKAGISVLYLRGVTLEGKKLVIDK